MTDSDFTAGPNELLLRLNATGICYSDLHYMMEDLPMPKMSAFNVRSPGHEGAGVVVKIGSDVKTWKVGDRGGVKPMWDTCMNCEWCWDGKHETYCAGAIVTGLTVAGELNDIILMGKRKALADNSIRHISALHSKPHKIHHKNPG
jgi:propanol-preferring alcohol dehydrogenase